jgi:hypothetical protein
VDNVCRDLRAMRRKVREILSRAGVYRPGVHLVVVLRGRRVKCVFSNPRGAVLALGPAERRGWVA